MNKYYRIFFYDGCRSSVNVYQSSIGIRPNYQCPTIGCMRGLTGAYNTIYNKTIDIITI